MSWPFLFLITIGIAATLGVFADCVIVNMHCKLVADSALIIISNLFKFLVLDDHHFVLVLMILRIMMTARGLGSFTMFTLVVMFLILLCFFILSLICGTEQYHFMNISILCSATSTIRRLWIRLLPLIDCFAIFTFPFFSFESFGSCWHLWHGCRFLMNFLRFWGCVNTFGD